MACCVFTAFVMNRIIKACEVLDVQILNVQYNDLEEKEATASSVKSALDTMYLSLSGMTCAACVGNIEKSLLRVNGVERCSVSLSLQRATVLYDPLRATSKNLISSIQEVGYEARPYGRGAEENIEVIQQNAKLKELRMSFTSALFVASLIATADAVRSFRPLRSTLVDVLAVLANFVLASWVNFRDAAFIHKTAWLQGRKGFATMDTLLSLSLLLAYILSAFNIVISGVSKGQTYLTSSTSLAVVLIGGRYVHVLMSRSNAGFLVKLFRLQAESAMVMVKSSEVWLICAATRMNHSRINRRIYRQCYSNPETE